MKNPMQQRFLRNFLSRREYYAQNYSWDGICTNPLCKHDYIGDCKGNCTCLSCNAQRQWEEKVGLKFEEVE